MKAGRGGLLALAPIVAALAVSAPVAHAGSYNVYSCTIDGSYHANNAWVANNTPAGDARYLTDATCPKSGDPLQVLLPGGNSFAFGTNAALFFYAPPDALITDYELVIWHYWYAPPDAKTYELTSLGPTFFGGAGQFDAATVQPLAAEGHWYGGGGAIDTKAITRTLSDSTVARKQGSAGFMTLSAGCWDTAGCTLAANANVFLDLYGSRITITDNTVPALSGPTAGSGLLAPGARSGDEPVSFNATDNVGIRRAELVDVTDAANPSVVGSEDYNATPTTQKARCDYSRPRPCPDLKNETLAASSSLVGRRTLLVRVTDAAGNQTVSAPFVVTARGPVNGSGGGDGARLIAGFPGHARRGHRRVGVLRPSKTVGWGHSARVRGILRNTDGQPIAGAQLHLLIRDLKLGSHYVDRVTLDTGADGRFTFRITRGPSRRFRIAYRAYPGDAQLTAKSDITFNTKARITARAPHHVRSRGVARFRGRLVGHPLPPGGVTLELQAHQPGRGWRTVKTTRTRRGGAFSTRYRFNSSAGRFTFRMRLRPSDSYPYARGTSRPMRVRVG